MTAAVSQRARDSFPMKLLRGLLLCMRHVLVAAARDNPGGDAAADITGMVRREAPVKQHRLPSVPDDSDELSASEELSRPTSVV